MLELLEFRKQMIRWGAGALVAMVLVALGLLVRGCILQHDRDHAQAQAVAAAKEAKAAKENEAAAVRQAKAATEAADRAEQDARDWRVKYERAKANIPPKPPPIPETDPELAQALTAEGLSTGVMVVPEGVTALVHQDAQKALSWAFLAKRVPALEEAVAVGSETIKAQDLALAAAKVETAAQVRVVETLRVNEKASANQIRALGEQVKVTEKQVRNERIQKWLFTGLASVLAYKVGKGSR